MRNLLLLSACIITLAACNLGYRGAESPVLMTVGTDVIESLPTTSVEIEVLAVLPTDVPTMQPFPVCTPREDWPVYVVIAGDTLSSIAVRSGSTITELVAANCMDNPGLIFVHQQLRVPRITKN